MSICDDRIRIHRHVSSKQNVFSPAKNAPDKSELIIALPCLALRLTLKVIAKFSLKEGAIQNYFFSPFFLTKAFNFLFASISLN